MGGVARLVRQAVGRVPADPWLYALAPRVRRLRRSTIRQHHHAAVGSVGIREGDATSADTTSCGRAIVGPPADISHRRARGRDPRVAIPQITQSPTDIGRRTCGWTAPYWHASNGRNRAADPARGSGGRAGRAHAGRAAGYWPMFERAAGFLVGTDR